MLHPTAKPAARTTFLAIQDHPSRNKGGHDSGVAGYFETVDTGDHQGDLVDGSAAIVNPSPTVQVDARRFTLL
jgi:hypothetical protein